MDNKINVRLDAVRYYLAHEESLRKTAPKFNVSYRTLFKWVKWFREHGEKRLLDTYRRPWNRYDRRQEERVAAVKESNPGITLRSAQHRLLEEGLAVSLKGIWNIWRRYGFAGIDKRSAGNYFTQSKCVTREARVRIEQAKKLFDAGYPRDAAVVLNSVPYLPLNDVVKQLPDDQLSLRRRLEKTAALFGITPVHKYLDDLRELQADLRRAGLHYSLLQAGIIEVMALEWIYRPVEQLKKVRELKAAIASREGGASYLNFELRFILAISEAIACVELSRYRKALRIARQCRRMLAYRKFRPMQLMIDLGALYTYLDEFKKAEAQHRAVMESTADRETKRILQGGLANIMFSSGNYRELNRIIRSKEFVQEWSIRARIWIFRAMVSLMKGEPQKAIDQCAEALKISRQDELNRQIFNAYNIIACAHSSMGNCARARQVFRRLAVFLKKVNLRRYLPEIGLLLRPKSTARYRRRARGDIPPSIRLILQLAAGSYQRAYDLARQKGILSTFFRYVFFYPDIVVSRLHKSQPTYLPRPVLMLPAFNDEKITFHIKFLGRLIVGRGEKVIGTRLKPKDGALLIQIACRANTPGKRIPLDRLIGNFWPGTRRPAQNLAHALVRIKKALGIPTHLLSVSRSKPAVILNRGIFFTSDYQLYGETIAQAQALKRAQMWDLALTEFRRAFGQWRSEPFRRMFDAWSEELRTVALGRFKDDLDDFHRAAKARGDTGAVRFANNSAAAVSGSIIR